MDVPKVNVVQLVISWQPGTAGVQVQGPIGDRMLSYALLEMAKDAIRSYVPSPILAPPADFRMPS